MGSTVHQPNGVETYDVTTNTYHQNRPLPAISPNEWGHYCRKDEAHEQLKLAIMPKTAQLVIYEDLKVVTSGCHVFLTFDEIV